MDLHGLQSVVLGAVEVASVLIEVLAVGIIIVAIVYGSTVFVTRRRTAGNYNDYRARLGRALGLGLEVLVAADVIRTVALEPSLGNVMVLGLLVLIRTFLSWSLVVEIEGRWPWEQRRVEEIAAPDR